ncbi:hypothetical protein L195_g027163 [Trifolium pratense]|uniref:Uncharacterized protein n=1 Tax=Trifolium pratense TaxID=57577 RepID=A0A2K3KYC2_TRIPR|nr:hypothetical protein L195_g027163 [Trifolium pratense]
MDPLESELFTLKSLCAEPDQLGIVYGRQGITVENRSGPRRSRSKNMVEALTHKEVRAKISRNGCWSCSKIWNSM